MFALTADAPEAQALFDHAATLLGGRDPRDVVRSGTETELHENRVGQILCTLQALAAHVALTDSWPRSRVLAGYSVGEVGAWGMSGLLSLNDTLDLVAKRAEVMDAHSTPGDGMLFVRGLARQVVEGLCARHGTAIAIVNPGGAFILGGPGGTLDDLADEARVLGASRVTRVAVHVASHTGRLAAASAEFLACCDGFAIGSVPLDGVRLLSGIDGATVRDIPDAVRKLADQISQPVLWADCLQSCAEGGARAFLELGPGRALSEMAALAHPGIPTRSLDDFRSLQGARDWLAALER
jgi:[acyl-carrier-protein] S-malonyltransferase